MCFVSKNIYLELGLFTRVISLSFLTYAQHNILWGFKILSHVNSRLYKNSTNVNITILSSFCLSPFSQNNLNLMEIEIHVHVFD